jgi:predicted nucleotide-binding protein
MQSSGVDVKLWAKGIFGASRFPIEDLEAQLRSADFALLIAAPDDRVISRGRTSDSPRDNVVFELGLFMGAISRHRSFLLIPRGVDVKIPTNLLGLTPLRYDPNAKSLRRASSGARRELLRAIRTLGPR